MAQFEIGARAKYTSARAVTKNDVFGIGPRRVEADDLEAVDHLKFYPGRALQHHQAITRLPPQSLCQMQSTRSPTIRIGSTQSRHLAAFFLPPLFFWQAGSLHHNSGPPAFPVCYLRIAG